MNFSFLRIKQVLYQVERSLDKSFKGLNRNHAIICNNLIIKTDKRQVLHFFTSQIYYNFKNIGSLIVVHFILSAEDLKQC